MEHVINKIYNFAFSHLTLIHALSVLKGFTLRKIISVFLIQLEKTKSQIVNIMQTITIVLNARNIIIYLKIEKNVLKLKIKLIFVKFMIVQRPVLLVEVEYYLMIKKDAILLNKKIQIVYFIFNLPIAKNAMKVIF